MKRILAAVAVGSALLAGCSSGSSTSATGTPTPSGSAPGTPTASQSASASGTGGSTTSATPTETSSPSPSGSPLPSLPPAVRTLEQGGIYYGVYLAVGSADDPKLTRAAQEAAALGFRAFPGSISCDQGAAEALGVSSDLLVVAVYFKHKGQANDLLPWLDSPPLGIAQIKAFCAD